MTTTPPSPLTLKAKLTIVSFGVFAALLISVIFLQFFPLNQRGTEFNSIDDVRRAMMAPGSSDSSSNELAGENGKPISLRGIVRPHPSDSIIYTLAPDLDLQFVRARVVTNSCGMRSPERPVAKDPNVYRIALLGDSFAFGWGVEQKESFAQILEDTLNKKTKGTRKVEVLNFGVPGYSTFQEVALYKELAADFQPDAVLVFFVQNDFGMPFFIRDLSGSGGILTTLKFVQLGRKLLAPGEADKQMQQMGLTPFRALKELDTVTRESGVKTFLTINPRESEMSDFGKLKKLQGLGIEFLPLRAGLLEIIERDKINDVDLTLSYDPHPSPLRHKILGELLASYFLKVL